MVGCHARHKCEFCLFPGSGHFVVGHPSVTFIRPGLLLALVLIKAYLLTYLLTYCPSCHRQLGQQQILSISGGLEPVSVRFPMNVPLLSPLPQQYVSMSSLEARVFCVPLVSIRLLLLGLSLDLCVIYGLSIFSVYVQLWFLYFLAGIHRKSSDLKLFEARRSLQFFEDF